MYRPVEGFETADKLPERLVPDAFAAVSVGIASRLTSLSSSSLTRICNDERGQNTRGHVMSTQKVITLHELHAGYVNANRPITILQSFNSPTLVSDLREGVSVFYSFDNWENFSNIQGINYILTNQSDFVYLSKQEQASRIEGERYRKSTLIRSAQLMRKLETTGNFGKLGCELVKSAKGNKLYKCQLE
jgi:hypothetical protein